MTVRTPAVYDARHPGGVVEVHIQYFVNFTMNIFDVDVDDCVLSLH
jgi:hypothetical protein